MAARPGVLDASPGVTLRVLFIGNSYTSVNDLPSMTKALIGNSHRAAGVFVDSVIVGGATLKNHWDTGTAQQRIETGQFSQVVLQDQSLEPCMDPDPFVLYAAQFATLAQSTNAKVLIYGTWPRDFGDPVYTGSWASRSPDDLEQCLEVGFARATAAPARRWST